MTTNSEISKLNGKARPENLPQKEAENAESASDNQSEQDVLFRLKSAIDNRGRYAFRLSDMAAGYAAGAGVSLTVAKRTIEGRFLDQFGMSPQEYLDRHYEEMRENRPAGKARESSSGREMSR